MDDDREDDMEEHEAGDEEAEEVLYSKMYLNGMVIPPGINLSAEQIREIEIREQDRFLPVANIARIMKKVLPVNAKITKDSKEAIQECVSEFISFITSEASDKCQQEKRKTINGDDLLWAMSTLGFEKYVEPLKLYLAKYRDAVKGEKPEKKGSGGGMSTSSPHIGSMLLGAPPGPPVYQPSAFGFPSAIPPQTLNPNFTSDNSQYIVKTPEGQSLLYVDAITGQPVDPKNVHYKVEDIADSSSGNNYVISGSSGTLG